MSTLLLHACCGPCSLMPAKVLCEQGHEVTLFFANPNIHPLSEYFRRREAMQACADALALPVLFLDEVYNMSGWIKYTYDHNIAENPAGERCRWCYASRLTLTAHVAREQGFTCFSTSLLYSRHQRHDMIRAEAEKAARAGVDFLYLDFRQYWQDGIDYSKELGVFRQNYCACIFSEEERFAKKLAKFKA